MIGTREYEISGQHIESRMSEINDPGDAEDKREPQGQKGINDARCESGD